MPFTSTARAVLTAVLLSTLGTASAWAQSDAMSSGEISKVDKAASKITIKHGEIKNLDMPPMTMVFQVRDPSLLEKAKPGDKVRFSAEQTQGVLVVTAIEVAP